MITSGTLKLIQALEQSGTLPLRARCHAMSGHQAGKGATISMFVQSRRKASCQPVDIMPALTTPACLSTAYALLLEPSTNIFETMGFSTPCVPNTQCVNACRPRKACVAVICLGSRAGGLLCTVHLCGDTTNTPRFRNHYDFRQGTDITPYCECGLRTSTTPSLHTIPTRVLRTSRHAAL